MGDRKVSTSRLHVARSTHGELQAIQGRYVCLGDVAVDDGQSLWIQDPKDYETLRSSNFRYKYLKCETEEQGADGGKGSTIKCSIATGPAGFYYPRAIGTSRGRSKVEKGHSAGLCTQGCAACHRCAEAVLGLVQEELSAGARRQSIT